MFGVNVASAGASIIVRHRAWMLGWLQKPFQSSPGGSAPWKCFTTNSLYTSVRSLSRRRGDCFHEHRLVSRIPPRWNLHTHVAYIGSYA